ncbi:hypothetical protein [Thermoactinomyces mirandus]|uniref:hypothetical protein n=1 Tax=Thermoactinomyces mirandus TaxID=2756294 RepID=UPI001C69247F|nr:hypothetical protein [Thermoactinomyces mirandus]
MKHNNLFDLGLKVGSRFQGLAFKKVNDKGGRIRFPVGIDQKKIILPLAKVPFKDQMPSHQSKQAKDESCFLCRLHE